MSALWGDIMGYTEERNTFDSKRKEWEDHTKATFVTKANEALDKAVEAARAMALAYMTWEKDGTSAPVAKKLGKIYDTAAATAKQTQKQAEEALTFAAYGTNENHDAGEGVGKHRQKNMGPTLKAQFVELSKLLETAGKEAVLEFKAKEQKANDELKARLALKAQQEAALAQQQREAALAQQQREAALAQQQIKTGLRTHIANTNAHSPTEKDESKPRFNFKSIKPPSANDLKTEFMKQYNLEIKASWFTKRGLSKDPTLEDILKHAKDTYSTKSRTFLICIQQGLVDAKGEPTDKANNALKMDTPTSKSSAKDSDEGRPHGPR